MQNVNYVRIKHTARDSVHYAVCAVLCSEWALLYSNCIDTCTQIFGTWQLQYAIVLCPSQRRHVPYRLFIWILFSFRLPSPLPHPQQLVLYNLICCSFFSFRSLHTIPSFVISVPIPDRKRFDSKADIVCIERTRTRTQTDTNNVAP